MPKRLRIVLLMLSLVAGEYFNVLCLFIERIPHRKRTQGSRETFKPGSWKWILIWQSQTPLLLVVLAKRGSGVQWRYDRHRFEQHGT
jgi:hypothetical protein